MEEATGRARAATWAIRALLAKGTLVRDPKKETKCIWAATRVKGDLWQSVSQVLSSQASIARFMNQEVVRAAWDAGLCYGQQRATFWPLRGDWPHADVQ